MCSPASVILASIVTILVSFEAILKRISVNINFRSQFKGNFPIISFKIDQNCFKTYKYCDNTCKYCTCRWTLFSSIGSILVIIISILTSIATILASIEQVNTPYKIVSYTSQVLLLSKLLNSIIDSNFLYWFLSRYTEARKDREKFRKRLVEVIMHRDEWDDEDAEPGLLHETL